MAFWNPAAEHLDRLGCGDWCCSYSGGKDSTCVVTWVEWLRRAGWITVDRPRLIMSDTGVEDVGLQTISAEMIRLLGRLGWHCEVVKPLVHERLYNRILGIGNVPVHPGIRNMRWCTRSTKIAPMERRNPGVLMVTGLRLGESSIRDEKLMKGMSVGCAAGGECGIPGPSSNTYSPLLRWSTCNVLDWLEGGCSRDVSDTISDLLHLTRQLVGIYRVQVDRNTFDGFDPAVSMARFGCIGCPAIAAGKDAPKSVVAKYGQNSPLCEIYDVWNEAREKRNRCYSPAKHRARNEFGGYGPIKMDVRKRFFARIMDIQRRAGVTIITQEDEAFIRKCWADSRYPRGWSAADELTPGPVQDTPLFSNS